MARMASMNASHWLVALLGPSLAACLDLATFPGGFDASQPTTASDTSVHEVDDLATHTVDSATDTLADDTLVEDALEEDTSLDAPEIAPTVSEQIAAVRASADGALSQRLDDVTVTSLKPALGADPAGFFLQAEAAGPALFVAVDPASLELAVGDRLRLDVTAVRTVEARREVSAVTDIVVLARGASIDTLIVDVSTADDLTRAIDDYTFELVTLTATIAGPWQDRGDEHLAAPIETAGISDDPKLVLRLPRALPHALDLTAGCSVRVTAPLWRMDDEAQPMAEDEDDIVLIDCPRPRLLEAIAISPTEVRLRFDRTLDPSSEADLELEAFDRELEVVTATLDGTDVLVTTSEQVPGLPYTVEAGPSLRDRQGQSVDPTHDTAVLVGFGEAPALELREINTYIILQPNHTRCELLELGVTRGGNIAGYEVQVNERLQVRFGAPGLELVETGDVIVVHLNPSGINCRGVDAEGDRIPGAFDEVNAPDEVASSTFYPGAFDVWARSVLAGLSTQSSTTVIHDARGAIIDAAAFWREDTTVLSSAVEALEAVRQAGEWTDPGHPYDEESYGENAVVGIDLANSLPTSPSLRRVGPTDTNSAADWELGPQSFGE